jgi:beta-lactamase regulating signal transducer with metallopeptidase domain
VMPGTWIAAAASPAASPSASPSAPQAATRDWRGIALLGIWGCGFLAIASTRVRMWRRLRDTLETSTPLQLPDISIPAPVRVRAAAGVLEPGVIGWRQPVLLMPADIDQHLAPAEIEAIVAHELCHIDRRDNLTARMHMAAEAIFWFHPLVWWIGGRLVDERERACDEAVLRTSTSPRAYAQAILNVCKRYTTSPLASVSGVSSAHVRQRIDAILDHRIGEPLSVSKRLLLGAAIVLVAIVPLGAGAINAAHADVQPRALLRVQSFALIVSRNDGESGQPDQLGPNLTRSTRTDCNAPAPNASPCGTHASSPGTIAADSITISQLTDLIANALQQRVDDRTGLTGRFDVHLTWTPDAGGGPSLFTAVREQLGLKLQPVVAIDRAPED